jgi:hypothetical protein
VVGIRVAGVTEVTWARATVLYVDQVQWGHWDQYPRDPDTSPLDPSDPDPRDPDPRDPDPRDPDPRDPDPRDPDPSDPDPIDSN